MKKEFDFAYVEFYVPMKMPITSHRDLMFSEDLS